MNNLPTYQEIAESFRLWGEYVDPRGTMTVEEFAALSTAEKIDLQTKCFGAEITEEEER